MEEGNVESHSAKESKGKEIVTKKIIEEAHANSVALAKEEAHKGKGKALKRSREEFTTQ